MLERLLTLLFLIIIMIIVLAYMDEIGLFFRKLFKRIYNKSKNIVNINNTQKKTVTFDLDDNTFLNNDYDDTTNNSYEFFTNNENQNNDNSMDNTQSEIMYDDNASNNTFFSDFTI